MSYSLDVQVLLYDIDVQVLLYGVDHGVSRRDLSFDILRDRHCLRASATSLMCLSLSETSAEEIKRAGETARRGAVRLRAIA